MQQDEHRYDDMLRLPHHVSAKHPQMSALGRAAQFSPFAALTGYDDAVKETARVTDTMPELDDDEKERISARLNLLQGQLAAHPAGRREITITYFVPDSKKSGGTFVSATGAVKKINEVERLVRMQSSKEIPIANILRVDGELFKILEE